jgi:hypothetical protein
MSELSWRKTFREIVEQIVDGINCGWNHLRVIRDFDASDDEGELILNEMMAAVVSKFESCTLESILLLIQYSLQLPYIENSCFFIDALMKKFETRKLLDSRQGMLLWSHAKFSKEEQSNWKDVSQKQLGNSAPMSWTNCQSTNSSTFSITKNTSRTRTRETSMNCIKEIGICVPLCQSLFSGTARKRI